MAQFPSSLTTHKSIIGLDLSGTGAPRAWQRSEDTEAESFIMGRLAGLASLADRGGVDFLALDSSFRLGGPWRRDAWLDGAVAASRLSRHTHRATLVATVPLGVTEPAHVAGAITSVHRASAERAGWQVEPSTASHRSSARAVDAVISAWSAPTARHRTGPVAGAPERARPLVVVGVRSPLDLELAAARADIARLTVSTLEEARLARASIRVAAREWGRRPEDVRVLVDIHTVISGDQRSAQARWELLAALEGGSSAGGLRAVGTAADLATLWHNWVRAGAADGFTVIPASVPTDVIALVQDVVPELTARGLRSQAPVVVGAQTPAARPAARRPARARTVAVGA